MENKNHSNKFLKYIVKTAMLLLAVCVVAMASPEPVCASGKTRIKTVSGALGGIGSAISGADNGNVQVGASISESSDVAPEWTTFTNILSKWVLRLGGVVMLVGGVNVGIGWLSDDPSRKAAGFMILASGGIICALVGVALTAFS